MAYGSVTGVARINSHLAGGYSVSSTPTAAAVTEWLEQGNAAVDMTLAKAGYSIPVASTAAVYPVIVRLNNLYAAACAEQSTNIGLGDAETRSNKLWAQYKDELASLLDGDLTLVGLSRANTAPAMRYMRSKELRRRDGYAHRFDEGNTEYASGTTDDLTLLEPWRLGGGKPESDY